jgi:serine/threonine protein kinase
VLDCLTDLKERFQGFVDGQNTFEELKNAVTQETLNCNDTIVRDFVSNAHRDGLLSNTHFRTLIDEISSITGQQYYHDLKRAANLNASDSLPKQLTVLNNRFVLGPIIGKGGMGVVYKARDLRKMEANDNDDIVAIKILSSNLRAHPESLVVLQREAKKVQKLAHPNIVTVYDFDRDGDVAYMTMEFLDGIPLSKIIQAHAPLPRNQAIRILSSIARGLSYAHRHKIIHSDLKPSNVFILKDGSIKILDFGIAQAFMANEEKSSFSSLFEKQSFSAFTPAYASCEMIENMPPSPKDDIYALGCVAHELLTRKHPYERMAANKAKEKKLTVKRDRNLNSSDYHAIKRAVNFNKEQRTNSVNEFMRELSGSHPKTSISTSQAISIALVLLVIFGGIYTTNKIKTYETLTAQQAAIVNKLEIDNAFKQANRYLKDAAQIDPNNNDALTLYKHILKLDPENSQAIAAIESLKKIYIKQTQSAINSNKLDRASKLIEVIETSFDKSTEALQLKDDLNQHLLDKNIEHLVNKALQEELNANYVRPKNANAYDTYLEILKLAPDNNLAKAGIEGIRRKILNEAESLIHNSEWSNAESRIKDALLISPGDKDAVALFNEIKAKRLSERYKQIQSTTNRNPEDAVANTDDSSTEIGNKLASERLTISLNKLVEYHTKQAKYYNEKNILFGPDSSNAAFYYKKILEEEPSNAFAKKGLDAAWTAFINTVRRDVEASEFNSALSKLEESKDLFSPIYNVPQMILEIEAKRDHQFSETNKKNSITSLLTQAKSQISNNKWTVPEGDNAMESYLKVHSLDPNNEEANNGLKQVEYIFASRIKSKINKAKFSESEKILRHALNIFPDSTTLKNLKPFIVKAKKQHAQTIQKREFDQKISGLTSDAEIAMKRKHYILPIGQSAYDLYSNITSLDPGNTTAIRGLSEAAFRAYEQVEYDIRNKNYKIAELRLIRFSQLDVDSKRYNDLVAKLSKANNTYSVSKEKHTITQSYLLDMLMFASKQEAEGSTWPPSIDNAFTIYKEVLTLDPLNNTARQSLKKIFNKRITLVDDLISKQHWSEAERELNKLDRLYKRKEERAVISSMLSKLTKLKDKNTQQRSVTNLGTF